VKVEIPDLTAQECGEIAITAAEGGIGYWSVIDEYAFERWLVEDELLDVPDDFVFYTIRFENPDSGAPSRLSADITPQVLRHGFEAGLAADRDRGGWFFRDLIAKNREDWTGEIDSEGADMIVQFGLFGEVVFS